MTGKIIKGIAGFYYVHTGKKVYACKAKGGFRNQNRKPLVGDNVEITVLDETDAEGNIENLLPRNSELIRPAVANIDQVMVVFAAAKPEPNFNLLDRYLVTMERQEIPVILCFNKVDLIDSDRQDFYRRIYAKSGYPVIFASTYERHGMDEVRAALEGKTTALAGPSGVGKSSITNLLNPEANMDTGVLSRKIDRGKHTTRHSQLIPLGTDTYLMDTPGFSSVYFLDMEAEELKDYYREFKEFEPYCKYGGCNHIGEKECGVKQAVEKGELAGSRYENYRLFFEELKTKKRY